MVKMSCDPALMAGDQYYLRKCITSVGMNIQLSKTAVIQRNCLHEVIA